MPSFLRIRVGTSTTLSTARSLFQSTHLPTPCSHTLELTPRSSSSSLRHARSWLTISTIAKQQSTMAATDPNLNSTTEGQICFICGSQDPQCIEDVYQWKQAKVCRAQCIIGRDIPVCRENFYWEVGRVIEFDVNSSKHCISFFDGTEWLTVDPTPMATYLKLYKEQNAAATAKQQPECQFKTLNMSPTSMIHCTPRQTLPLSPPEHNRPPASESLMAVSTCISYARKVKTEANNSPIKLLNSAYSIPCLSFSGDAQYSRRW
mmetsp:Transcript_10302/g.28954  ORF Transcript_10302/g.28954 Transcript_10302/m.28954 type:complete len:262 (+) Transcript_10302:155-940(+)